MLKAASISRGPSLSKAWEVAKAHKGAYSGGKVELSNDGSFVACLYESDVSFVDVEEGVVSRRLRREGSPGGEEEIVSFALHPNGSEIVTASRSLLLRHWDVPSGECKRAIKAHDHTVLCMAYDGSGTLVVTGSSDHTAKVWDVERGYCTHNFRGHKGVVSVVAFHPNPKRLLLVTGSEDTTVRVWNLQEQSCTAVLKAHLSYVTSLAFLPGNSGLISGGRDRVLNVWDLDSSDVLKTFPVYEEVEGLQVLPARSESGAFSGKFPAPRPGGNLVAVAGKGGVVRVFELDGQAQGGDEEEHSQGKNKKNKTRSKLTCRCVMTQDNQAASHKAGYTDLLLDPSRGGLLGVTDDHNLLLLEGGGGRGGGGATLTTLRQIVGYNDEVIDVKSLPSGSGAGPGGLGEAGESWVAVATNSPQVRLFELGSFSCRLLDGHTDTVLALDVAPDGRHLCTSSKDRTCLLWDLELGVPVVRWSGHADAVGAVAASRRPGPWSTTASSSSSSTGAFVVSGAADRTIQRWDVPCRPLAALEQQARDSRAVAVAAAAATALTVGTVDGGAGGGGGEGDIGKAVAGKGRKKGAAAVAAAWAPPAPLLETARRSVRGHEKDVNCLSVSPDDAVVASASQDRTVKLWRSSDLELLGVLKGHKRGVWKVEFSPVDRCVASCSGDRTVKLWSTTDFSCLRTFQGHTASVLSVAFVSAGAQLVSGGADGLLKVWTLRSDECEATLDAHTDKVWALTTAKAPRRRHGEEEEGGGEEEEGGAGGAGAGGLSAGPNAGLVVVSGGADSVINVWKDVTAREEEKVIAERESALLKEQELYNCLRNKDYGPAIKLALELKRPQRLWGVLRDAMTEGMGENVPGSTDEEATTEMSSRRLDEHVSSWTLETIAQCLGYCRDWNTNARKAVVVHALVGSILRCVSVASLKELPGCAELVRVLLPYSERHFQRLDRLLQSSYLVEHTLASMHMLVAQGGDGLPSSLGGGINGASGSNGPLMQELKRLREGGGDRSRRGVENEKRRDRGVGMEDDSGGSGSDSDDSEEGDVQVPVSETVGGRVVFNVRIAPAAEAAGGATSDGDSDGGGDGDVAMGDALPVSANGHAGVVGRGGEEDGAGDEGEDSAQKRKKKKRKKRSASAAAEPLGLVGQPVVAAAAAAAAIVDGAVAPVAEEEGEAAQEGSGSGKKSRKKRRRSSPAVVADDDDSADASGPASSAAAEGAGVGAAAAGEDKTKAAVVAEEGEQVGEGGGKKKKKKRSGKGRRKAAAV